MRQGREASSGVYQHCGEKHLHCYLGNLTSATITASSFGHGNVERTVSAVKGAEGKRLTYNQSTSAHMAV
ncbi:hypothetical protein A8B73_12885 [Methylosinus sp. 3S-1]|nr:hypothetical protein A8B73_12885 [Methylosinus sp. 3S-1]